MVSYEPSEPLLTEKFIREIARTTPRLLMHPMSLSGSLLIYSYDMGFLIAVRQTDIRQIVIEINNQKLRHIAVLSAISR